MSIDPVRVLEIRHAETEPPGSYGPALDELADVTTLRIWREDVPDDLSDVEAIVTLGGAMGVDDAPAIGWIDHEIVLLRRALELGIPVWGVCLGSQMLAAALGAQVYRGDTPEIGVHTVTLDPHAIDDPIWGVDPGEPDAVPTEFRVVQWHFDTFDLPAGATRLASSPWCANQLFRHGDSYGVQFHLEADGGLVGEWLGSPESRNLVREAIGAAATDRFATDATAAEVVAVPLAHTVMRRWLRGIAERR
ncbi:type 1 glutamine amidotransferase [Gordonia paraffinivorans]|uniref:type 1 glutamine amidotransferase n=1 Tax=Gordonia paraffinivorans TaxID=175628 RepID=UPI001041685E|nr:type 1 glutamine amidotransferase [Gordonia paraffinivorans]